MRREYSLMRMWQRCCPDSLGWKYFPFFLPFASIGFASMGEHHISASQNLYKPGGSSKYEFTTVPYTRSVVPRVTITGLTVAVFFTAIYEHNILRPTMHNVAKFFNMKYNLHTIYKNYNGRKNSVRYFLTQPKQLIIT